MKNRLLFTTALIAAAFAVSDARAERLVVSSGEEEAVNAEMSANDNSELQGGAILNSGKLTVADGVVFNGHRLRRRRRLSGYRRPGSCADDR